MEQSSKNSSKKIQGSVFDTLYNQAPDFMMKEIARVLKHGGIYVGISEDIFTQPIDGFNLIPDNSSYHTETVYQKS